MINLGGLAVSLSLVIILSLYCYSELTTDRFHKNIDRIYFYGSASNNLFSPGVLKEHIDLKVPGVEATIRISDTWDAPVFRYGKNEPFTSDMIFVDDDFFKVFSYKSMSGDLHKALTEPMSVVITKSLSDKLFGSEPAIGKTIKYNNNQELTVNAVIEEPTTNSSLVFQAVTSMSTRKILQPNDGEFTEWNWYNFRTFVLLKNDADPLETGKIIRGLFPRAEQAQQKDNTLISFKELYFYKFFDFGATSYIKSGQKSKILILLLVAALVLIIALVNFINISTYQWNDKIRQTGVMKIIGAKRSVILINILSESALLFFTALMISFFIVNFSSPFIRNYTGVYFNEQLLFSGGFIVLSFTITLLLSALFSLFPALHISSSKATDNINKRAIFSRTRISTKAILVSIQFTIAIVLIAFTILVTKQIKFGGSNLGFNQENIIGIQLNSELHEKREILRKILTEYPEVKKLSFTQYYPGKMSSEWARPLIIDGETKEVGFKTFCADETFFEMMNLRLIQGRFYSDTVATDANKVIVNEAFLRKYDLADVTGGLINTFRDGQNYEIVGVVKDFHYRPVNEPIAPLVIRNDPHYSCCLVNLQTKNFEQLRISYDKIKKTSTGLSPSFPTEITFLDLAVQNMYKSELLFQRAFTLFAGCAIVISCLGMLALSLFSCQQRTKEIGIRKVNGARDLEVITMLNVDFIKWVLVSFIIACPLAWFIMHKWLENFAYKTEISWWIFALSGILSVGISFLTISWQSWRAATRNPVESLRYE
jgi:putative ABC transport system permease protein